MKSYPPQKSWKTCPLKRVVIKYVIPISWKGLAIKLSEFSPKIIPPCLHCLHFPSENIPGIPTWPCTPRSLTLTQKTWVSLWQMEEKLRKHRKLKRFSNQTPGATENNIWNKNLIPLRFFPGTRSMTQLRILWHPTLPFQRHHDNIFSTQVFEDLRHFWERHPCIEPKICHPWMFKGF